MGVTCSPLTYQYPVAPHQRVDNDRSRLFGSFVVATSLSLVFVPEYVQGLGDPAAKSFLYDAAWEGFRVIDVVLLLLVAVHALALACWRERRACLPRTLLWLMAGFAVAIVVSLLHGVRNGGQNFFFDWRALALGAGLYLVYRFWIQTPEEANAALGIFGFIVGTRLAFLLTSYAAGGGAVLLGVRIPAFDGPTISAAVGAALLGVSLSATHAGWRRRGAWLLLSALALVFIALCFRRSYWAELALGLLILGLLNARFVTRIALLLMMAGALAWVALGPSLQQRIASLDVRDDDSPYAEDNSDHLGDILDAWDQVRQSPVMGLGLGRSYPTSRIRNWKDESVMVHNAPLHVWLKYGLLGLGFYLAYHLALFAWLRQQGKRAPPAHRAWLNAVLAYLAAQFLVSLGFAPWPYSAVQSTNLIAFLLAIAFVQVPLCHCQPSRWSPQPTTARNIWKTPSSA
jgi:O-antigen ligase